MNQKLIKRFLSAFLAVVMVMSLALTVNPNAFAVNAVTEPILLENSAEDKLSPKPRDGKLPIKRYAAFIQKHLAFALVTYLRRPNKPCFFSFTGSWALAEVPVAEEAASAFALVAGIIGLWLAYYLSASAGAAICLILAVIFVITFFCRKVRL